MKITKARLKELIKEELEAMKSSESEPLEEVLDAMDQNVIDGMVQIMNNFGIASWPAMAVALGLAAKETSEQAIAIGQKLKSYAAKKAGVNIKTR